LRVGIVGIGFGQNVLVPAFRADARTVVQALCARSLERARAVADRLAVPEAFGDWRALIETCALDAIAVAVPPTLQVEIARAAVARGRHIFCEKPVALDPAQARALLEQARTAGVAHAVDFEFVELPSWKRARELLQAGALGSLRGFALTWHIETRANRLQSDSWKVRAALGGGALGSFASHSFQLLEWLLGPLARLQARLYPPDAAADTRVTATCRLADGTLGTVSIATDAVAGWGHRLEIHGSEGTLLLANETAEHLSNFVLTHATRAGRQVLLDERTGEGGDGRIAPVAAVVRRFVDAALGGAPAYPGLDEGVRVEDVMNAVRESHRRGTWVEV
jgi:predicted dehydrogenase